LFQVPASLHLIPDSSKESRELCLAIRDVVFFIIAGRKMDRLEGGSADLTRDGRDDALLSREMPNDPYAPTGGAAPITASPRIDCGRSFDTFSRDRRSALGTAHRTFAIGGDCVLTAAGTVAMDDERSRTEAHDNQHQWRGTTSSRRGALRR
jgi:hypothetical protein